MSCLDKTRERYEALQRAERAAKPKATVRRWPRNVRLPVTREQILRKGFAIPPSLVPASLSTPTPWRVKFYHRGENAPRFRHFALHAEAVEFARNSWHL